MTKKVLGVLAALSMVGLVACSSSSDNNNNGGKTDSGTTADAGGDTKPSVVDGGDTGTPPADTATPADETTGKLCTTDDDCDVTFEGVTICSKGKFGSSGGNDLYPSNVCIGIECDPGDGTSIMGCDNDHGVCLSTGSGGICLPVCQFDDSGAAPVGCEGSNGCNVYGWGKDDSGKQIGIGYCFGGCDETTHKCGTGQTCQTEDGLCQKTVTAYSLKLGDACTKADATATPPKCNCFYATSTGQGMCTTSCRIGGDACATGYTCDANLPLKNSDDTPAFSKTPTGMMGQCLKTCTADSDCTAFGFKCVQHAGIATKTCSIE